MRSDRLALAALLIASSLAIGIALHVSSAPPRATLVETWSRHVDGLNVSRYDVVSEGRVVGYAVRIEEGVFNAGVLTLTLYSIGEKTWVDAELSKSASAIAGICSLVLSERRGAFEVSIVLALSNYPLRSALFTEKIMEELVITSSGNVKVVGVRKWVDFGDGCPAAIRASLITSGCG